MKKSKVILAIALAVVIVITCVSVPTFSWFTRPQSQSGKEMELQTKNTYTAYNGKNVTISTKSSATGVEDSYTTDANNENDCSGVAVTPYNRRYFCTTITNASTTVQNVSLYARTLSIPTTSNGTLALGVNAPTRSYRDYSALATPSKKTTSNSMRIYFEKDNNVDGWSGTDFYICWNEDPDTGHESLDSTGSNGTYYKLTHVGGNDNPNQYYADIPKTATHAFFAVENWGTNDNGNPKWSQRSQTLWNLAGDGQKQTSSLLYKITNTDINGNKKVEKYTVTGNCINTYYSSVFVAVGNRFDARLTKNTEYIGGSLEYYAYPEDGSIFKMTDANGNLTNTGGYITAVSAGEGSLFTKSVGGSYPDTQQVETKVYVTSAANYVFNDVPIVKNIQIPVDNSDTEDKNEGEIKIYWYVINNSPSNNLTYTIDNIYLSL